MRCCNAFIFFGGGVPIWARPSRFVLFGLFGEFSVQSGIVPIGPSSRSSSLSTYLVRGRGRKFPNVDLLN